ncbi:hypothetical protein N9O51_05005 [Saprospiraceae bacterium]|nr:hypothetical protein [Saprospiraceae bacterium]
MENKENTFQNAMNMNMIALNNTIFKKTMIIGQGFRGGDKKHASITPRGCPVWINGIHNLPAISEITVYHEMGSIHYPYLMHGMGDCGGEIKYRIAVTEYEYVLMVGVLLNDSLEHTDEYAWDVGSFVYRDSIPLDTTLNDVGENLLLAHFAHFLGNNGVDFKNSIESEMNLFLSSSLDFYIENAENEVNCMLGNDN